MIELEWQVNLQVLSFSIHAVSSIQVIIQFYGCVLCILRNILFYGRSINTLHIRAVHVGCSGLRRGRGGIVLLLQMGRGRVLDGSVWSAVCLGSENKYNCVRTYPQDDKSRYVKFETLSLSTRMCVVALCQK